MHKDSWLQRLLYLIMMILGCYILYKGGKLLFSSAYIQRMLDTGRLQQSLETAAMRTYMSGYTAAVEQRKPESWISFFMNPTVPVYSYIAAEQAELQDADKYPDTVLENQTDTGDAQEGAADNKANTGDTQEGAVDNKTNAGEKTGTVEQKTANAEDDQEEIVENCDNIGDSQADENDNSDENVENIQEAAAISGTGQLLLEQLQDFQYLLNQYYTVDVGTTADEELLDASALLGTDLSVQKNSEVPQILIYHTHAQEAFADSREGVVEDTIVGMGSVLAEHLRSYGYQVIHDTGVYDLVDGVLDRSAAYDYAREAILQILEENPTIEVIIDLHRDGVEGMKFVTQIGGKPCSKIMFFNGISRNQLDEPITYLENPYIRENLAFSLQLQLKAREQYPDYTRNIYLKAERFNLHLRSRSLLVEAGTQMNTVEEEKNAMKPLADLICQVLEGK